MARRVEIIGVPVDYGANRRGVDMGASAIRYAGLADALESNGLECRDTGDITIVSSFDDAGEGPRNLPETRAVCDRLSESMAESLEEEWTPLVLGGDHSVAIGSLRGSVSEGRVGVVWFDAHADFNTPETSPSGNIHGMPLASAVGRGELAGWAAAQGLREEDIVLIGVRSIDEREEELLRESDVTVYTMEDVDIKGIDQVVREALTIALEGTEGIHLSLDMDVLDPEEAPGVGTPEYGGLTYREAHLAMELVAKRDEEEDVLTSMEVVEVNPILDRENRTAELAVDLVASAFGKRIF